jgi:type II secretory pathway pseudopilin PulG
MELIIVDPLPLSVNQNQLKLMQNCVSQAIAQLQDERQAGQFASGDDKKREQNVLTYGTSNYEEAYTLIQAIEDQLKSHIEAWNSDPSDSKPVPLALNSYQIELLRTYIERQMHNFDSSKNDELQTSTDKQQYGTTDPAEVAKMFENLIKQLPESSPHEDSD